MPKHPHGSSRQAALVLVRFDPARHVWSELPLAITTSGLIVSAGRRVCPLRNSAISGNGFPDRARPKRSGWSRDFEARSVIWNRPAQPLEHCALRRYVVVQPRRLFSGTDRSGSARCGRVRELDARATCSDRVHKTVNPTICSKCEDRQHQTLESGTAIYSLDTLGIGYAAICAASTSVWRTAWTSTSG
jgi:hypothetical protein